MLPLKSSMERYQTFHKNHANRLLQKPRELLPILFVRFIFCTDRVYHIYIFYLHCSHKQHETMRSILKHAIILHQSHQVSTVISETVAGKSIGQRNRKQFYHTMMKKQEYNKQFFFWFGPGLQTRSIFVQSSSFNTSSACFTRSNSNSTFLFLRIKIRVRQQF